MRLGRGAWVRPGAEDATHAGRRLFLDAVADLYPEVLQELRALLPAYQGNDAEALAGAWRTWQASWRLYDAWVAETAEWTLRLWARGDLADGEWFTRWSHPTWPYFKVIEVKEEDRPRAWCPETESWEEYVQNLERHYRASFEDRLRAAGFRPAGEVRARAGAPADLHFRWLARYQVGRERQAEIAANPDPRSRRRRVAVKTVQDALRAKRRLIGLLPPE